jgi:hypothetical protein
VKDCGVSALSAAVVSIVRTQRGRFFWAVWWSAAPVETPFRAPDASNGGARTRQDAMREAERIAGRALLEIEARWARACVRVMRGQEPFTLAERMAALSGERRPPRVKKDGAASPPASAWQVLGVEPSASVLEIKSAYRARALETHPDRGGDPNAFRALHRAYESAIARRAKAARRPKRKR